MVSHPTNGTTFLSARIADDGTFTAYGAGLHAGVSVCGWVRDRAGRIDAELSGETACDASWSLTAS